MQNNDLNKKLQKKNYEDAYRENKRLHLELKNMYILQEENKDLKEDLERLKAMSYDKKVKATVEENNQLRKRNGMLMIQNDELSEKLMEAKKKLTKEAVKDGSLAGNTTEDTSP